MATVDPATPDQGDANAEVAPVLAGTAAATALIGYLRAVAAELQRCGVRVTGLEVNSSHHLLGGWISLGVRSAPGCPPASRLVALWAEDLGWYLASYLRGEVPIPCRFLPSEPGPSPAIVVAFVLALLGGEEPGSPRWAPPAKAILDRTALLAVLTTYSSGAAGVGLGEAEGPGHESHG